MPIYNILKVMDSRRHKEAVFSLLELFLFIDLHTVFVVTDAQYLNVPDCPPWKHKFTNCSDPCHHDGAITVCKAWPGALCIPDFCGACVPRFFNDLYVELHCETEIGVICEQKSNVISCPENQRIQITKASYGRSSKTVCRHPYDIERLHNNTDCRSPKSLTVMRKLCDDKTSCDVRVESDVFGGDPCHGIYKYLEYGYSCFPSKANSGRDIHDTEFSNVSGKVLSDTLLRHARNYPLPNQITKPVEDGSGSNNGGLPPIG